MRKYEISCTIIIQALSQLKAMYKDEWEVIVGNCDTAIFLGGSDATSLEYISKKLGKETIRSINNSRSFGKQGSHSLSYNKTGRELMTTDELNVMDNDNCIVFIRGLYPFFTKKYELEKHPNYKRTGDANRKLCFNVKERFHTGHNLHAMPEENKAVKLYRESQRADSREAEREYRMHNRPVARRTHAGKPAMEVIPAEEIIPNIGVPVDQLTDQQRLEREAAQANLELEKVFVPQEQEAVAGYAEDLAEMADLPDMNQIFLDNYAPDTMEEEEYSSTDTSVFDDFGDEETGE